MTRDRDEFVELEDRAKFANGQEADLFVSIHVNSHPQRSVKGIEIYHFGEAKDQRALEVAARENGTPLNSTGVGWEYLVADLLTAKKIEASLELAWTAKEAMVTNLNDHYALVDHGVKTAPFYVLRFTSMPSILAEIAYISNSAEEDLLRTSRFTTRVAEALMEGINDLPRLCETSPRDDLCTVLSPTSMSYGQVSPGIRWDLATPGGSANPITHDPRGHRTSHPPGQPDHGIRHRRRPNGLRRACASDKSRAFARTEIGPRPTGCGRSMPCCRKTLPFVPPPSRTTTFMPNTMHEASSIPIGSSTVRPAPPSIAHSSGTSIEPLNEVAMQQAAATLIGSQDFSSFEGSLTDNSNPICHLQRLAVIRHDDQILIEAYADRFLKHMVRAMVGTVVEVGLGKRTPDSLTEVLRARDRSAAGQTAPPHGLCLMRVDYD